MTGLEPAGVPALCAHSRAADRIAAVAAEGRRFIGLCKTKSPHSLRNTDLVRVSLKDLAKPSKINGLQAASKVLLS